MVPGRADARPVCGVRVEGAREWSRDESARSRDSIQPFEVVPLSPGAGEGSSVSVTGARVTVDGGLQILVDGFSCGVPTNLDLEETRDAVSVSAYATKYTEGPCPADIVPWYVPAELKSPLDGREVVAAQTGKPVQVDDCRANAESDSCDH